MGGRAPGEHSSPLFNENVIRHVYLRRQSARRVFRTIFEAGRKEYKLQLGMRVNYFYVWERKSTIARDLPGGFRRGSVKISEGMWLHSCKRSVPGNRREKFGQGYDRW